MVTAVYFSEYESTPQPSAQSSSSEALAAAAAGEPIAITPNQNTNIIIAYASVATLTLDAQPSQITAAFIANLDSQISTDCACEATVVAITTPDNITTFCTPTSCVPPNPPQRRRLLSTQQQITVEITLISNTAITRAPHQPTCPDHAILHWQTYQCQPISDPAFVHDRRRLAVYFKRTGTPWVMEQTPGSWAQYYLVIGIIFAVFFLLAAGGGGAVYYVQVYHVHGVDADRGKVEYFRRGRVEPSERDILLPDSWNKRW
jgi:hypothetical protein